MTSPEDPDPEADWREIYRRNLDAKFSDAPTQTRWSEYARKVANGLGRADLAADSDEVVNQAWFQMRERLDRAESPEELGPGWPTEPYVYRTLNWTVKGMQRTRQAREPSALEDKADPTDHYELSDSQTLVRQRAMDLINSLGFKGELRAQALYVVDRTIGFREPITLPLQFKAPTEWEQAMYEALAFTNPRLQQEPLDAAAFRVQMQRRKRALKHRLRGFSDGMGDT